MKTQMRGTDTSSQIGLNGRKVAYLRNWGVLEAFRWHGCGAEVEGGRERCNSVYKTTGMDTARLCLLYALGVSPLRVSRSVLQTTEILCGMHWGRCDGAELSPNRRLDAQVSFGAPPVRQTWTSGDITDLTDCLLARARTQCSLRTFLANSPREQHNNSSSKPETDIAMASPEARERFARKNEEDDLRRAFDFLDRKKDGKIDEDDLTQVFMSLQHRTKKGEINDMIWEVDEDCDNAVNWKA